MILQNALPLEWEKEREKGIKFDTSCKNEKPSRISSENLVIKSGYCKKVVQQSLPTRMNASTCTYDLHGASYIETSILDHHRHFVLHPRGVFEQHLRNSPLVIGLDRRKSVWKKNADAKVIDGRMIVLEDFRA